MTHNNKIRTSRWRTTALLALICLLAACGENRFQAREAENFTLPRLDGAGTLSLHSYRGEVIYLTFWASWCVPCRDEMPHLARLWERQRERGFQVLAVNVDEDIDAARRFAREYALPFPIVRDADREISRRYRVPGFPTHYLIDRRGRIRFSAVGFNEDDAAAVSQEVETLLQESVGGAG